MTARSMIMARSAAIPSSAKRLPEVPTADHRSTVLMSSRFSGPIGTPRSRIIRDVLELCRSRDLENGLAVGVSNRRGVTVRLPTDGGEQERDLAARYRADALACALTWPRTRAVLERIAESYDAHAKWEDEHAEQRDWA